jgi:hypothetical protein
MGILLRDLLYTPIRYIARTFLRSSLNKKGEGGCDAKDWMSSAKPVSALLGRELQR